jgi:alpha-1,3-rhamnosyl/mannosyltransferase
MPSLRESPEQRTTGVGQRIGVILAVDAISAPLTGIGRYAVELARRLPLHPGVDSLSLFAAFRWVPSIDEALASNRLAAAARQRLPFKGLALRAAWTLRQALFSRGARALRGRVLHAPNFIPFRHDGPVVTTVHDLSWIHNPEHHPPERVSFMDRMMPVAMQRADIVLTDSEFVRREVLARWPRVPQHVLAVPLGVDARFAPRARADCREVLARHGIGDEPYLLSVATLEPRKNLGRLAQAYGALPASLRERHPLVVVGARGWNFGADARRIEPLLRSGQMRMLGYVDDADLPPLYAAAHSFAFVSLYEGFGLPPLEAMASGIPVLVSNRAALPEIGADAAIGVDPEDVGAIREGLARLVVDEDWRSAAARRGCARAAGYTWERCIDATVAAYQRALAA